MRVFCPTCGYANEATAAGVGVTCRSCGVTFTARAPAAPAQPVASPAPNPAPVAPPPPPVRLGTGPTPYNTLAVVSAVMGFLCCLSPLSLVAIGLGVVAKQQIEKSNGQQQGLQVAMLGIALGAIGFVLFLVTIFAGTLFH